MGGCQRGQLDRQIGGAMATKLPLRGRSGRDDDAEIPLPLRLRRGLGSGAEVAAPLVVAPRASKHFVASIKESSGSCES